MACNTTTAQFVCDSCHVRIRNIVVNATRMASELMAIHSKLSPQCKANMIVRDQ